MTQCAVPPELVPALQPLLTRLRGSAPPPMAAVLLTPLEVTDTPGAQRTVLEFWYFVATPYGVFVYSVVDCGGQGETLES